MEAGDVSIHWINAVSQRRLVVLLPLLLVACTSFGTLRSAEVVPGPLFVVQASTSTPPGDDAAWLWSFDCASQCNHPIVAADLNVGYGFAFAKGPAVAASVGMSGTYPYFDGYPQL